SAASPTRSCSGRAGRTADGSLSSETLLPMLSTHLRSLLSPDNRPDHVPTRTPYSSFGALRYLRYLWHFGLRVSKLQRLCLDRSPFFRTRRGLQATLDHQRDRARCHH